MTNNSEMEAKVAILDKCCQSVECLARGKVFDLVGTLDLPQSSSSETATDKHGVFKSSDGWRYRHYGQPHMEGQSAGPYSTRAAAMEALLHAVGFAVESDQPAGLAQTPRERKLEKVLTRLLTETRSVHAMPELPTDICRAVNAESSSRPMATRFAVNEWTINETWKAIHRALAASALSQSSTDRPAPEFNLGAYIDDNTDDGR